MSSLSWDSILIAPDDTASANVIIKSAVIAVLLVVVVVPLCLALSAGLANSF